MAYLPTILIDLVTNSVDYGKIVSSIENTSISADENVYYQVKSPLGVIVKAFDYNTPDAVLTVAQPSASLPLVSLPQVSNGGFEEGTYTIKYQIEDPGTPGVYVDVDLSFELEILKQGNDTCILIGLLEFLVDCLCLKMTVTDKTDYKETTLISRVMTIVPPTVPNESVPVNIVTPNETITFDFGYSGVTYVASLFSIYEHTAVTAPPTFPDVVIRESITSSQSYEVICDHNLCKLIECIEAFFVACVKEASMRGGIQKLPRDKIEAWLLIENYLARYHAAALCNNYELLDFYYRELQRLTGCDCGCAGTASSTPVKLVAVCNSTGYISEILGTAPVTVGTNSGVATVSLDQVFLDSLYYGAWNVSTDILVASPGGVEVNSTPEPFRWSINNSLETVRIEGSFKVILAIIGTIGLLDGTAPSPILIPAPVAARVAGRISCFDSSGNCVGSVHLGPGALRNVVFTPNTHYVQGITVFMNGVFNIDE